VRAPVSPGLVSPVSALPDSVRRWRRWDLPGSWTNPCVRASVLDPGETSVPGHCGTSVLPSFSPKNTGFLYVAVSRFAIAARFARCLRFAVRITPLPRKTRFSAGGQPLPGGPLTHRVHSRKVSRWLHHRSSSPRLSWRNGDKPRPYVCGQCAGTERRRFRRHRSARSGIT
jgi:hypothetical protein